MMVKLTIDGIQVEAQEDMTILEAAMTANIRIPTLCYNKYLKPYGGCRICLVEIAHGNAGMKSSIVSSCTYPVGDGLIVDTKSDKVMEGRRFIIELLLARCPDSEELRRIAHEFGVSAEDPASLDDIGIYLFTRAPKREHTNCILCGLCVRVCAEVVQRTALGMSSRGPEKKVGTPFNRISKTCIGCGSCAYLCPTSTITIEEES